MAAANDNQAIEALTFGLGGEVFAIDAHAVREILDLVPVTRVPGSRDFVPGLINVRGRVVPLADLKVKFGMPAREADIDTRIVVVEIDLGGEPTIVGLLADKVYEVTEIGGASIEETPEIGMKWRPDFIRGIGKRGAEFIIIPDFDRVFASD
jgi:purine-binding chemotaxis protein CheW